jgi:hypothetical protein
LQACGQGLGILNIRLRQVSWRALGDVIRSHWCIVAARDRPLDWHLDKMHVRQAMGRYIWRVSGFE